MSQSQTVALLVDSRLQDDFFAWGSSPFTFWVNCTKRYGHSFHTMQHHLLQVREDLPMGTFGKLIRNCSVERVRNKGFGDLRRISQLYSTPLYQWI